MLGSYRTLMIVGLMIVIGVPIAIFAHQIDKIQISRGLQGQIAIPAYSALQTDTGVLQSPPSFGGGRSFFDFGLVVSPEQDFIGFSCNPGDPKLDCVYSKPYIKSPLVGQNISIKYFTMPNWLYPAYNVETPASSGFTSGRVPRRPANIIMEATTSDATGTRIILSYRSSADRLERYNAQPRLPLLVVVLILWTAIFVAAVAYSIFAGRRA